MLPNKNKYDYIDACHSRLLFDGKRSELIMVSRNKFQFWKFTIMEASRACQGLVLQREYHLAEGACVNNAEYDEEVGPGHIVPDGEGVFWFHPCLRTHNYKTKLDEKQVKFS